jgi:hypothetical protein
MPAIQFYQLLMHGNMILLSYATPSLSYVQVLVHFLMLSACLCRVLFQGGLHCQILSLSFSRIRKFMMVGQFPWLHTLNLDDSYSITSLPDGCFRAMPKLASLSMCGTGISNLWTTSAALFKLPSLSELRFQRCLCCQGTGPCTAMTARTLSDASGLQEGNTDQVSWQFQH